MCSIVPIVVKKILVQRFNALHAFHGDGAMERRKRNKRKKFVKIPASRQAGVLSVSSVFYSKRFVVWGLMLSGDRTWLTCGIQAG